MTDFPDLIADARAFYQQLKANNTKAWWQENRSIYDDNLKPNAQKLLEALTDPLAKLTDAPIKTKLFRPHRDVRFSKDKTPYNTHLHMMWQVDAGAPQNPVFFFGIGLDYVTAGAGMMGFDKPVLTNWRKMLDLDTDRITGIIDRIEDKGFSLREPALKRVPPPYPQDHAAGRLLRMKGVTASRDLGPDAELPDGLMQCFRGLWPFNELLISIAEA
jgi:uncharacterized protein (TIGR02453 family)